MLEASLDVTVGEGGGVGFRFVVENAGADTVALRFRDSAPADFAVYAVDGETEREVWRWSDGRAFAQVLRDARLEPGERTAFEETWPDPRPGDYTAEAELRVTDRAVRARTPFSV